ncbi:MAG: RagB/SusD family nutrient uptake outer membrane protein [Ginsengibacter sp.]
MKKIVNIFLAAIFLLSILPACKKSFLDEKVYSSYAPQTLTDSLGFDASLVGLYNQLSQFYTTSDQQGFLSVWQVGTDIAYAAQQQGVEVPYYDYSLLTSTDRAAGDTWRWMYQMVNNANIIIKNVEDPTVTGISDAGKKRIEGEARFFRAWAYNILATCFGPVPVVKEPLSAPKTDFVRAPLTEVNALIEEDLLFAGTNLPDIDAVPVNSGGKRLYGRANNAMAHQLLAEAYLRMNKNDLAEQQAVAIINSGKFSLTTSRYGIRASQPGDPFSDMFIYGNERRSQGNMEAIWVLEMEDPNVVIGGITNSPQQRRVWNVAYYQITNMIITDSLGGRGLARLRLNDYVNYGIYEQNDMRNSSYNYKRDFYYNDITKSNYGQKVPYTGFDTIYRIAPHTTKWNQFDPKDVFGFAMIKDIPLMRLGETYLLLAEAQFKQGKLAEAAASINVLRARANATPVTPAEVTMDYILDERIRELVGEENRRMTLMRTGTLVDRATRYNSVSPINQMEGISSKNLLMPIPQSEIDLNKDAVLDQNPGY